MECEVLVIGGGIVGASVAYALAPHARVVLAEREPHPGYHSTGRSAAAFIATYGNKPVRALNVASRQFLEHPDPGFASGALLRDRGILTIATESQLSTLRVRYDELKEFSPGIEFHDGAYARRYVPLLNERTIACLYDRDAQDIDVSSLLEGYLRGCRAHGGRVLTACEITAIAFADGAWHLHTSRGTLIAETVVNAAGAWADSVAQLAGLAPLGLMPLRRTAVLVAAPEHIDVSSWPIVLDTDEQFYFKPEAGKLLISPADETESEPTDAQPDEYDIAVAVERFEKATTHSVKRLHHKWAGLRTFAPDRTPVIGYDPRAERFMWASGLGGYGVQTSPAVGRVCATLYGRSNSASSQSVFSVTSDAYEPRRLLQAEASTDSVVQNTVRC